MIVGERTYVQNILIGEWTPCERPHTKKQKGHKDLLLSKSSADSETYFRGAKTFVLVLLSL